tara:strand:+ start:1640 stop:1930 length:291 start_codon:yes stop_codon:yes gene_type:complete
MSNDYNGWTNYETWRVNLEIFDGMTLEDFGGANSDAYDFKDSLKDYAEEVVFADCRYDERRPTNLMEDYARAFLSDVDWYQIATCMIENYKLENQE